MTTLAVSVTEFKTHCLDLIRQVEQVGDAVELTRHGKVVARLIPSTPAARGTPAWQRLRGQGKLLGAPEESVLDSEQFEAMRVNKQ
jgi:prevent-host-death family protein